MKNIGINSLRVVSFCKKTVLLLLAVCLFCVVAPHRAEAAIAFVRADGATGTSFTFDIGTAGTNRLVVVVADDEGTGAVPITGATVDGKSCTSITSADNSTGLGNQMQMWYIDEDGLGSSSGSVTVEITGGASDWAVHALLFTGVDQSGPSDNEKEESAAAVKTISVENVTVPANGLVVMAAGNGQDNTSWTSWTSPLTERTDAPVVDTDAEPTSAVFGTASGIETSQQTNKTYVATSSATTFNRGTGIVAVWAEADSLTLANHDQSQVSDKFTASSPVTDVLFRFKLSDSGSVTVTQIDVDFTTGGGVANGDVSDGELWLDVDNDGVVDDPGDTQLKDNVTPSSGTLSFTSLSQTPDSGKNYLVRATVSNLVASDTTTFSLTTGDITVSAGTKSGTASNAVHTQDTPGSPTLALDDHTNCQVGDQFTLSSSTTDVMFRFELTRTNTLNVTQIDVNFTTTDGVANNDVSDGELWRDENNNGVVDDGTDTQLKDNISPSSGVISFTSLTESPATTGTNYLVRATVNNLTGGDGTTFSMDTSDITVSAGTKSGTITDADHSFLDFTDIASSAGLNDTANTQTGYAAWSDMDSDGLVDVVFQEANSDDGPRLYLNDDGDSFTGSHDFGSFSYQRTIVLGDINNDGKRDAFFTYQEKLFKNTTGSSFSDITSSSGITNANPEGAAFLDYDNDGWLDVVHPDGNTGSANLWENNGNETFTNKTSAASLPTSGLGNGEWTGTADYDADGDMDIFHAVGTTLYLFRNNGGTFTDISSSSGLGSSKLTDSHGWCLGDYDNDGDFDLLVMRNGTNDLYRNNGNDTFTDVTSSSGDFNTVSADSTGCAAGDFDNDGDIDFYVVNDGQADDLFSNDGDNTFTEIGTTVGLTNNNSDKQESGAALADIDNDGDLDVFVNPAGTSTAVLYRNDLNNNKYLRVRVIGKGSGGGPKDGTGAIVYLYTNVGDFVAMRQVDGGRPFAQDENIVHFGLPASNGGACGRYKVNVLFPGGALKTSGTMVPSNKSITIGSTTLSQTVEIDESTAATVVSLVSFTATGQSNTVKVEWETATEMDNAGFHLYRASAPGGPYTRMNDKLISARPRQGKGANYSSLDTQVVVGQLYYYKLEDIDVFGTHTFHGPICVDWDGDGIPDDWEIAHGLNTWVNDTDLDYDGDGLSNIEEYERGLDPFNPDTDGDGILDGQEDGRLPKFEDSGSKSISRGVEVQAVDESGMTLALGTEGFDTKVVTVDGQEYEQLTIDDYVHGYTSQVGAPQLPIKGILIDVPEGKTAQLKVLNSTSETFSGYRIYPAPEATVDEQGSTAGVGQVFVQDEIAYSANGLYPQSIAQLGQSYIFRDQIKQQIIFNPIRFNPATGQLQLYRSIKVRIDFVDDTYAKVNTAANMPWKVQDNFSMVLSSMALSVAATPLLVNPIIPILSSLGAATAALWSPPDGTDGNVYKIITDTEDIYQISKNYLDTNGVNTAAINLNQLRIYHLGKEIAIEVFDQNSDDQMDATDFIRFYAQPVSSVYAKYSDQNVYWLTLSGGSGLPKRMATEDGSPAGRLLAADFPHLVHYEKDEVIWLKAPGADSLERWFFITSVQGSEHGGGGQPVPFTIAVPNPTSSGTLTIMMAGKTDTEHVINVAINGVAQSFNWSGISFYEAILEDVPLIDGDNSVTLQCLSSDGNDTIIVDWFKVAYRRDYVAGADNTLKFAPDSGSRYVIDGFSNSSLFAYDISDAADVMRITDYTVTGPDGQDKFSIEFEPASSGDTYYVMASDAINTPNSLVTEHASSLFDTANRADYILITHRDIGWDQNGDPLTWLTDLLAHRQSQGLRVFVADIEDIYDEFSFGIKSPQALKDFLAYAYSNWQEPAPQYVLLVGDSTYDPKGNWNMGDATAYLPTYLIYTDFKGETVTDQWFVTFSGDDAVADMHIGRLPAADAAQAAAMVVKIITYEIIPNTKFNDPDAWEKNILLIADDQRLGAQYLYEADFATMNEDAAALLPAFMNPYKGYLGIHYAEGAYLTDFITNTLNDEGALIVNYSGHGSTQVWAEQPRIFDTGDLPGLTNSAELPFFVSMNCESGFFAYPENWFFPSLAEALLRSDAGAVAALMPTGMTTTEGQRILNSALYEHIFSEDIRTLGPAIAAAKQTLLANGNAYFEQIANTFLLFGDPATALKVPVPRMPKNVQIHWKDNGTFIKWQAAKDSNGNPVAGYNLYRSLSVGGIYTKINSALITDTQYLDTVSADVSAQSSAGSASASYYYGVTSVDSSGDESVQTLGIRPAIISTSFASSSGGGCFIGSTKSYYTWNENLDAHLPILIRCIVLLLLLWLGLSLVIALNHKLKKYSL